MKRTPLSKQLQVFVFKRDGWLCQWCQRPVVFAPAMKYLEQLARERGNSAPLAYYDVRWRRDKAPLLDHLGAVIDHVEAHSHGGKAEHGNFVTSCNKCNTRKSNALSEDFTRKLPLHQVKGKYGEPKEWDGLSALFVVLIEHSRQPTTASERGWLLALKGRAI